MRISDEAIQHLYDALARWHVAPDVAANLQDLLTDDEIAEAVPRWTDCSRLTAGDADADTERLTGIDDHDHGLCVGPCDPGTAATEAAKCPFVCAIGVTDAEDSECSYQEWVEHFRDAAHRAVDEYEQSVPEVRWTGAMMKQVGVALTCGLKDGTRIEKRLGGCGSSRLLSGKPGRCRVGGGC